MGTARALLVWFSGLILRANNLDFGTDASAVLYWPRLDDWCGGALAGLALLVAAV
ncbi:hypothetical protein [Paraburkholderia caledonica]|uniref:hypothetical protein n=1 Tax=Paraburkholderia caledonica TaxID=134536 RepID=UPI0018782235